MMTRIVAAAVALLFLASCARVHPVDPTSPHAGLEEINKELRDRRVTVKLRGGTEFAAQDVEVGPEATSLTVLSPVVCDTALDNSTILALRFTRRRTSSIIGSIAGVLAGVTIGNAARHPDYDDLMPFFRVSGDAATRLTAVLCGIVGFGVGMAVGGAIGIVEVYDFTDSEEAP